MDTCPLIWFDKLELMVVGPSCQVVLNFDLTAHMSFSCWDLHMSWAGLTGPCSWASLGLVIPAKWIVLPWVIYVGFCSYKFCKRSIFKGWVIYISHELETLVYENMFLQRLVLGFEHNVIVFAKIKFGLCKYVPK